MRIFLATFKKTRFFWRALRKIPRSVSPHRGFPAGEDHLVGFYVEPSRKIEFLKRGQKDAQGSISPLRVRMKGVGAQGPRFDSVFNVFVFSMFSSVRPSVHPSFRPSGRPPGRPAARPPGQPSRAQPNGVGWAGLGGAGLGQAGNRNKDGITRTLNDTKGHSQTLKRTFEDSKGH